MVIGNKIFENNTYIMGILNVTPDSFSDGGKWNTLDSALKHAEQMIEEGADIIDIGGESTRPQYTQISDDEEINRIIPIIEAVTSNFDVPVSVDTYKSRVADAALSSGAVLINDIWGFKYDSKIADVCKKYNASCCLMHNRTKAVYNDFFGDVISDLKDSITIAENAGIVHEKICIDPGIGFAKSLEQNLRLTQNVDVLDKLGFPILLGTSRKSMIGLTLDLPSDQRLEGTLVTSVIAAQKHCLFVRVHDVKENYRAIKMTRALMNV